MRAEVNTAAVPVGTSGRHRSIPLLAGAAFASSCAIRLCDPLVPELGRVFGISAGQAAWSVSAFAIAYGLFQAVCGPAGDRYGKYQLVAWATLACAAASLAAALAPSFGWLVAARVLAGACGAAIIPLSMSYIGDSIEYHQRQPVLARFLAGQILGVVGGQLLGGFCAEQLGWRWSFAILGGVNAVLALALWLQLRRPRPAERATVPASWRTLPARTAHTLTDRRVRALLLVAFVEGAVVFGPFAFVPTYLHGRFGLSLTGAGLALSAFAAGGLCYSATARWLVPRLGERGLALTGGALLGAGFLGYLAGPAWQWAIPASLLAGMGFYGLHNTLQTRATQLMPRLRATTVSMFVSALFLGQSTGVALAAWVVDSAGAGWAFLVAAVTLPLLGAVVAAAGTDTGTAAGAGQPADAQG